MENFKIYEDIAKRTNGDIYIGVVGPVRCGKSLFITKMMQNLVIPNIKNKNAKQRAVDELPQSAEGKTIMTTQPNFVPNEAVKVNIDNLEMKVRMIDCVGYLISGAMGHEENSAPRLVKTPWDEKEMPFEDAAELGTKKVIDEHSTIGIVLTTDGTIAGIDRENYVQAEQRVIAEIKETNKPFVLIINSKTPKSEETKKLAKELTSKYEVPVLPLDVMNLNEREIANIFAKVLENFPLKSFAIDMPKWLSALPYEDSFIQTIIQEIKAFGEKVYKVGDVDKQKVLFDENDDFEAITVTNVDMSVGKVNIEVKPKPQLFYKVLSRQCDAKIESDFELVKYIRGLAHAKQEYDKLEEALESVKQTGYGVVAPRTEDMTLEDPQIVKQGGRFGVKLKASAPSLHIMRVDVETEVSPLVGTQQQSEDMVKYLMDQFEKEPSSIWNTNMFGKSLQGLVGDGIKSKIVLMPSEAQRKIRKTLGRIVNEGKGGIICILL